MWTEHWGSIWGTQGSVHLSFCSTQAEGLNYWFPQLRAYTQRDCFLSICPCPGWQSKCHQRLSVRATSAVSIPQPDQKPCSTSPPCELTSSHGNLYLVKYPSEQACSFDCTQSFPICKKDLDNDEGDRWPPSGPERKSCPPPQTLSPMRNWMGDCLPNTRRRIAHLQNKVCNYEVGS